MPTRDTLRPKKLSRRELLQDLAALSASTIPIARGLSLQNSISHQHPAPNQQVPLSTQLPPPSYLSPRDDSFLEEEEEEDDDVSNLIDGDIASDEET